MSTSSRCGCYRTPNGSSRATSSSISTRRSIGAAWYRSPPGAAIRPRSRSASPEPSSGAAGSSPARRSGCPTPRSYTFSWPGAASVWRGRDGSGRATRSGSPGRVTVSSPPTSAPAPRSSSGRRPDGGSVGVHLRRPMRARERLPDGVEQGRIVEWLGQELDRPRCHGAGGQRDVSVTRDEDDRGRVAGRRQRPLKIEAVLAGHSNVHDETARPFEVGALEELASGRERLHPVAIRSQQSRQAATDRQVVIDHENGGLALRHAGPPRSESLAMGRSNSTVAPRWRLLNTRTTPPWASMIERAIESPMPIPAGLVVKKGSKTTFWVPSRKPVPES